MCIVFDILGQRAIAVNDAYVGTPHWEIAVHHAQRHLDQGIDVFTICDPNCSGEGVQ
jgi:hypothetical protein